VAGVCGYFVWAELQKSESTDDAEIDGASSRSARAWAGT
jgi:hypothetical protein